MKNIAAIALFLASTFIAAGNASAQDRQVKANIPFSFTVGGRTLPAGEYSIGSRTSTPGVLSISSWENKVNILAMAIPGGGYDEKSNVLVFHRYGNQSFLSDLCAPGSSMNLHFPTTKAEKQVKTQIEEAGVLHNDPILVAVK
jgi:hypothetical protein